MPLSPATKALLDRVERTTGKPVEVVLDESFGPFEGVSRVATPSSPCHRIIVRDMEQESTIWHEVGHIERMMWTPPEDRRVVFLTQEAVEDLVDLGFGQILNGIVGQIHRTVRNVVPDILIEGRIFRTAPEHVLAQQQESFRAGHHAQVTSCIRLAESAYYKSLEPFVVLLGAYAKFGASVGKAELPDGKCSHLWERAREFLEILEEHSPPHEGADGAFMREWLTSWNVGRWFAWEPITYDLPYLPDVGLLKG